MHRPENLSLNLIVLFSDRIGLRLRNNISIHYVDFTITVPNIVVQFELKNFISRYKKKYRVAKISLWT